MYIRKMLGYFHVNHTLVLVYLYMYVSPGADPGVLPCSPEVLFLVFIFMCSQQWSYLKSNTSTNGKRVVVGIRDFRMMSL